MKGEKGVVLAPEAVPKRSSRCSVAYALLKKKNKREEKKKVM
jgi:hypothetical protein